MRLLSFGLSWLVLSLAAAWSAALDAAPRPDPTAVTNLVAWCIVPFDTMKRGPEERAAMLGRLGFTQLAYDWRAEHIPSFDAEVAALQRHGVALRAWWFPSTLNAEAQSILACIRRHQLHPELWVMSGEPAATGQKDKVNAAAESLLPVVRAASELGCKVGLYNHGGWFGEPENQLAIRARLAELGHHNVGLIYNFHHGHDHLDRLPAVFPAMVPHLLAVNLNGMVRDGERRGRKIVPFGGGEYDLAILRLIRESGYLGPVGILGHTEEDAEVKLKKDLAGLHDVERRLAAGESSAWPPVGPKREAIPSATLKLNGPERTGSVLDARKQGGRVLAGHPDFRSPPFTVEAWVRFQSKAGYNIIVASEAKASPTHWELYTQAGSGLLAFYAPGSTPVAADSNRDVCDGAWHHVAAHVNETQVRLWVDGVAVGEMAMQPTAEPTGGAAQVALGRLVEGGIGCDGWLDNVRIRRGLHAISRPPPTDLPADAQSLASWGFESEAELAASSNATQVPAIGTSRPRRTAAASPRESGTPRVSGQEPSVQKEQDWVDNRWSQMDVGPAFASNLHLPDGSVIAKALTLQLPGEGQQCVAYDLATGVLRAAWSGGFLKFDAARFGLMGGQKPATAPWFVSDAKEGFPGSQYRFLGLRMAAPQVMLEYEVDGVKVEEVVTVSGSGPTLRLVRHFAVESTTRPLAINAAQDSQPTPENGRADSIRRMALVYGRSNRAVVVMVDPPKSTGPGQEKNPVTLGIPAEKGRRLASICLVTQPLTDLPNPTADPRALLAPAGHPGRTPPLVVTTRGQRGADNDILAVDTLTMPYDNPAHALLFGSGVDLMSDGTAYVCTMHGDVWRVTGIDDSLRELTWTRFATGLFQPLGLKVRDGKVYVLGRDRITRLSDEDADGVADHYENFHDAIQTSTGGHDYVTCLEQDTAGNFYYVDPIGMHRVSADGRETALVAAGFRNPNGMGVSPDGRVLTAAPQQGTWTPSSGIWETRPDQPDIWGGYPEPKITATRPLGYDAPLCWIPHGVDNSSGSQVWIPTENWGPLGGQMLHLLWGRCGMMLVLRDVKDGRRNGVTVPLPVKFLSGPNRGSFHGNDLYVAGSTGWQTSAVRDGCLQRVRWTGKRFHQPVAWESRRQGFDVTFAEPLRTDTATDPGSYSVKRWNYKYAQQYGSKDWSVRNPTQEGRDEVTIRAARLSADRRTVSLELAPWDAVMQFELKYNLDSMEGKTVKGTLWGTVNAAGERRD